MTTVPPAPAEVDAWFAAGQMPGLVSNAIQNPGGEFTLWVLAYTQDNGEAAYAQMGDPTQDPATASVAFGLIQQYGAITVRGYSYEFVSPAPAASDVALDDAQQAVLNDPANWVTL
jgi:hypothetical protein